MLHGGVVEAQVPVQRPQLPPILKHEPFRLQPAVVCVLWIWLFGSLTIQTLVPFIMLSTKAWRMNRRLMKSTSTGMSTHAIDVDRPGPLRPFLWTWMFMWRWSLMMTWPCMSMRTYFPVHNVPGEDNKILESLKHCRIREFASILWFALTGLVRFDDSSIHSIPTLGRMLIPDQDDEPQFALWFWHAIVWLWWGRAQNLLKIGTYEQ